MKKEILEDIKNYAGLHTLYMQALIKNFDAIVADLKGNGINFKEVKSTDVVTAIARNANNVSINESADQVIAIIKQVDQKMLSLSEHDEAAMVAVRYVLQEEEGLTNKIAAFNKLLEVAPPNTGLALGLHWGLALMKDGSKTIYDLKYLEQNSGYPKEEANGDSSDSEIPPLHPRYPLLEGLLAADLLGGIGGAITGAVGTGAAMLLSGPFSAAGVVVGGAAGAVGGAIGNSALAYFEYLIGTKSFATLKYPYPHGPNDPNGPIGGFPGPIFA